MTLILVSGKAGCGKSTFAQYLVKKNPERFVEFALARKLKVITFKLLKLFNVPINSIDDLDNRQTKEKYRHYLQQIATEVFRSSFGDDFWCQQIKDEIDKALNLNKIVIISDVRFPNEQQYFHTNFSDDNVYDIMIHRKEADEVKSSHISENTNSLTSEYVINNNDSMEQFYKSIDDVVFGNILSSGDNNTESESLVNPLAVETEPEPEAEVVERAAPIIYELPKDDNTLKLTEPFGDESEHYKFIESSNSQKLVANDEKFIDMMTTNNTQNGSQQLGVIGEQYVLELIQQHIRPKNETILVSSMPHVADIHSVDYINNIFWVIEVKNKSNLTPEDVDKFKRDLKRMTQQNIQSNFQVVGLFLSLRSLSIPKIGDVYITGNEIYLSKTYFTPEILKIVFSFVEQWKQLLTDTTTRPQAGQASQDAIAATQYVIPAQTLELFALLNTEYQHINRDVELYDSMRHNCSENLQYIEELMISAKLKQRLIYCLNQQVSSSPIDGNIISQSTEETQYNMLIDYLKGQTSKSSIKKQTILQRYPILTTQINRIGWNDFRDTAWKLSHVEPVGIDKPTVDKPTVDKPAVDNNAESQTSMINIPEEVLAYCAKLSAENKTMTKNDLIKKYPEIKHDIQKYSWKTYKEQIIKEMSQME